MQLFLILFKKHYSFIKLDFFLSKKKDSLRKIKWKMICLMKNLSMKTF